MADLKDLIERLEKAEGRDLRLDADLFRFFGMPLPDNYMQIAINLKWDEAQEAFVYPLGDMQVRYNPPPYTASLDATLALCVRRVGEVEASAMLRNAAEAALVSQVREAATVTLQLEVVRHMLSALLQAVGGEGS